MTDAAVKQAEDDLEQAKVNLTEAAVKYALNLNQGYTDSGATVLMAAQAYSRANAAYLSVLGSLGG